MTVKVPGQARPNRRVSNPSASDSQIKAFSNPGAMSECYLPSSQFPGTHHERAPENGPRKHVWYRTRSCPSFHHGTDMNHPKSSGQKPKTWDHPRGRETKTHVGNEGTWEGGGARGGRGQPRDTASWMAVAACCNCFLFLVLS